MSKKLFTAIGLKENYVGTETHGFKLVLNPSVLKQSAFVKLNLIDPSGQERPFRIHRWGTKVNIEFDVTKEWPEGVAHFYVRLEKKDGTSDGSYVRFWVIK